MEAERSRGDIHQPRPAAPPPAPSGPPEGRERAEAHDVAAELAGIGIVLDAVTEEALALYLRRIRQWSERINLVSAHDLERLGRRHLLESFNVLACPFLLAGARLVDAGSGAGFPGIPLAVVEPALEVLLIESVRKKAAFLSRMVSDLGLAQAAPAAQAEGVASSPLPATTVSGIVSGIVPQVPALPATTAPPPLSRVAVAAERAEVLAEAPEHRSRYGILTVRGFGPLARAVRECGDLLAPGGFLVAFKGSAPEREVREALAIMEGRRLVLADIMPMRWGEGCLVLLRRKGEGDRRS